LTIRRERGRWRAILKSGRVYVGGRTFDTRREGQAWLNREQASLAGGVDPRAGRARCAHLLPVWLEERRYAVSAKTYIADSALPRLVPTSLGALSIASVTDREATRALVSVSRIGLAESSVRGGGPDCAPSGCVTSSRCPCRSSSFNERAGGGQGEAHQVGQVAACAGGRPRAADGAELADRELDAPLFVTSSGSSAAGVGVQADPRLGQRRGGAHPCLRHTAACVWLARGVDPVTVQAWMGHASIATTNLYLHHLGTSADRAGLDRLNRPRHAGGTQRGVRSE
jgi:hypothetical protein